jgi:phage-related protein
VASTAEIIVKYLADTAGLSKASGDIEQAGGKVSKSMGGVAKAVGGAFAVGAVVAFGKSAVGAAEESAEATARLDNVFKQMGDTTGEASKAAQDYASELSAQTAIEDEAIMSAQAMLATFGKVSDETARNAGVFDRATAAAADLAATGFGSLEGNAVQLGKALQDPVKGITALAKSGVTFTDAQKAMIKSMVESGDHLGAQQLVLAAIEKQVKGTAAATASESEKMATSFGEVQESLGTALLPALNELAPILAKVAKFIADNSSVIVPLVGVVLGLAAAIKVITFAQLAWNVAVSANPLGLIVLGIAALVVAIVLLVKHWDQVTAAFVKGWAVIKQTAQSVFDWFKANWPLLLGILAGPFGLAVALIIRHWDAIKSAVRTAADAIRGFIVGLGTTIASWVTNAGAALGRLAEKFDAPVDAARAMVNAIKDLVGSIAGYIQGQVGRIASAIERVVDAIKRPINAVLSGWNAITFSVPRISLPSVTIAGKKIGGGEFGGQSWGLPNIPLLARGGVVDTPTLLVAGEAGREIIAPEALLRQIMREQAVQVRVFIGDRELTDLVRVEVADANTGLARQLLAGTVPA